MPAAATVYVKDLAPMAAFYEVCFGLRMVADAPGDYRVLGSGAWALSIVQVPPAVAATIHIDRPPTRRRSSPVKLSFEVPAIADLRPTIRDLGGSVDDGSWEFAGFRHVDCVDPEGNVVELREAVTAGR